MRWLVLALVGGLGAMCRALVDHAVARVAPRPLGSLMVNVTGSFAAGVVVGAVGVGALTPQVAQIVTVGFLGAYTTFSTATVDVLGLLEDGARSHAVLLTACMLVGAIGAAFAGVTLVR